MGKRPPALSIILSVSILCIALIIHCQKIALVSAININNVEQQKRSRLLISMSEEPIVTTNDGSNKSVIEKAKEEKSWEDDDDDDDDNVNFVDLTYDKLIAKNQVVVNNNNNNQTALVDEEEIVGGGEKENVGDQDQISTKKSEWPEDDDDDDDDNVSVGSVVLPAEEKNNKPVTDYDTSPKLTENEGLGATSNTVSDNNMNEKEEEGSDDVPPTLNETKKKSPATSPTWDDDDDVIHDAYKNKDVDKISATKSLGDEANMPKDRDDADITLIHHDNVTQEETASLGGTKQQESTSEWSEDDDDDDTAIQAVQNNDQDVSMVGGIESVKQEDEENDKGALLKNAVKEDNGSGSLINVENLIKEEVVPPEQKESTSEWPEDDDDDVTAIQDIQKDFQNVSNTGNESVKGDNEREDVDALLVDAFDNTSTLNEGNGLEEPTKFGYGIGDNFDSVEVDRESETAVDEELLSVSPEPTAYHRNQSSQGDDVADEDEGADKSEVDKQTADIPENSKAGGEENVGAADIGSEKDNVPDNFDGNEANGNVPSATEEGAITLPPVDPNDVMIPNQQDTLPILENWDEEEDDSFFEMVQSTFNVLLLAAFMTSLLILRKRVMDRVHTDGVDLPTALKDELIDVAMRLVTWAINVLTGRQESTSNTDNAASTTNSNRGNETIPLSTAADEEWGWEDEEMGTNLELSGMGGGGGVNEAKEDDDLAMAIAMSLSESQNSGEEAKASTTTSVSSFSSSSTKMTRPTNNINSSRVSAKDKIKPQRSASPNVTSTTPPPSGGDSIEDLLGQMGGNGGVMITSFGQKPKPMSKPKKTTPKRESSDDIFASMGLSSIPKTSASSRPPAAPTSGGWQTKSRTQNEPTSAPLPSLRADSLGIDDEDADWGDDGDLDDLLDD